MYSLADAHQPSSSVQPAAQPTNDSEQRRTWLIVAATLLVVAGVVAMLAVAGRDTSPSPVVTEPPETASSEPCATPNADGDIAIDPADLRFSEPLPDGMVAFVNDTALPAPSVADYATSRRRQRPSPRPAARQHRDHRHGWDRACSSAARSSTCRPTPRPASPKARPSRSASRARPTATRTKVPSSSRSMAVAGSSPRTSTSPLAAVGRSSSRMPWSRSPQPSAAAAQRRRPASGILRLPRLGERRGNQPARRRGANHRGHGQAGSPNLALYRLAQPPTALELLAIRQRTLPRRTQRFDDRRRRADVRRAAHLEFVSPIDVVVLSSPVDLDARVAAIDFARWPS